ncbi:MAG: hypothetical protein E4H00_06625 [Myxococcales bacterium]|nr:MAG: hypothetical protein E4H00_06625 [Myxococcales bacterium]
MTAEAPEVSGKVFRFLSAMHPSLSKAERKRFASYDPDKWYEWTPELSTEFTDLMRRSPRDASFARGFAYVAQRAIPEGGYVPTKTLFESLDRLPAAFRSPQGSGFVAKLDSQGHAIVTYAGMPGFANVCIAIQGELTQRIQATGAQSVVVRHAPTCRVNGAPHCEFEVEWAGEATPQNAYAIDIEAFERESRPSVEPHDSRPAELQDDTPKTAPARAPVRTMQHQNDPTPPSAPLQPSPSGELSGDDLFQQLRKRLSEADRQARLYHDAQAEIARLKLEVGRVKAQADADIARAAKERDDANAAVADLKKRVRSLIGDD